MGKRCGIRKEIYGLTCYRQGINKVTRKIRKEKWSVTRGKKQRSENKHLRHFGAKGNKTKQKDKINTGMKGYGNRKEGIEKREEVAERKKEKEGEN